MPSKESLEQAREHWHGKVPDDYCLKSRGQSFYCATCEHTAALLDTVKGEAAKGAELQRDNVAMMLCRVLLKTTSSGDKLAADSIDLMRRMDCMPSIMRDPSSLETGLRDARRCCPPTAAPPPKGGEE